MSLISQFSLAGFVTCFATLSLGLLVFFHNRNSRVNRVFCLYSLAISEWSFFTALHSVVVSEAVSLFSAKAMHLGVALIPILFFHFCLEILGIYDRHKRKLLVGYLVSGVLIITNLTTPLVVAQVRPKLGYEYFMDGGLLYPVVIVFFATYVLFGLSLLLKGYSAATDNRRNQLKYLFYGSVLGYALGPSCFLPVYDITIFPYPFGSYAITVYVGITALAIVKYHLLDIEVIIRRTAVFAALFAFVYGVFMVFSMLGQGFFKNALGWNQWVAMIPTVLVITFSLRPLETFLVDITDKYLFQKRSDYRHMIGKYMEELKSMNLNPQDVGRSTVAFLNVSLRPLRSAIIMLNAFTNKYDYLTGHGVDERKLADLEPIATSILKQTLEPSYLKIELKYFPEDVKNELRSAGIELLIPLVIRRNLLGCLLLGAKKSDEDYTNEDLAVLSDLSAALAIALNNAQLFEQRADAEKRAMIGTLASGINHEINNPLSIISTGLQSFKILQREGLFNDKSKEEIMSVITKTIDACLAATSRISDITAKIAEFAKPDKKLTFDTFRLEIVIDETLAVLDHELSLNHIEMVKNVSPNLSPIQADKGQFKQILFNLVRNAAQAVGTNKGRIEIITRSGAPGQVMVEVKDNGCGISQKNLEKLFTPFYTTKEPGKGTGLGLALVKLMVERNNGRIEVESKEGEGSVFRVLFKASNNG